MTQMSDNACNVNLISEQTHMLGSLGSNCVFSHKEGNEVSYRFHHGIGHEVSLGVSPEVNHRESKNA